MSSELDSIDRAILAELQNDARLPNKDLAERVGVAPSTALERVRGLRRRGVITGFRAEVDAKALGRSLQAMLALQVRPHTSQLVDPLRAFILGLPETIALFHVAGPEDLLVHVAVPDADHLHRLILERILIRPEIFHLETTLIYRTERQPIQRPVG
ncbi:MULTISPECIES: Lrp/AsnC family transcriptional regulator [Planotetraspora]|uniref:AsnC family transcriptional regulator n=2 Tax=Planotetraspora TaxID=58120 RepID=A0A8J3XM56_9ACTN|nr:MULTISPECIES: Lrp/AsnC family transcriptional regulator [Planotetraspora]GII30972.1 AsnC family transcriptional regulator [Planotetraspora mira]GII45905.1 AsnC family transcriptional regulator [Planotetraspora silvatica]